MLRIKLKEHDNKLVPFFNIDGKDIRLLHVKGYKLQADADEYSRISIELESCIGNEDYNIKVSDKPIPHVSIVINDVEYDLQSVSYLKYMGLVEGIKSIWNNLDKEAQETFIHKAVDKGNYAQFRRYLEA